MPHIRMRARFLVFRASEKKEREGPVKRSTDAARSMSDAELQATRQLLAREIPRAQQLYDAVKREANRRKRQRGKDSQASRGREAQATQSAFALPIDATPLTAVTGARA
jgi:hypothetical protein